MTETMLERAARAMANVARSRADLGPTDRPMDPDGFAMMAVRAAIEAIREPDEARLRAGIAAIAAAHEETNDGHRTYFVTDAADYALPGWQAMIDAILSQSQEGK